jgi:pimeloyl-ACP methyl ester carboxylesterase
LVRCRDETTRAGVELAVLDECEGSPVLLLHGFPDSARLWRHRADLVGHDFGAAVAWDLAARFPERVDHLVVMSVGHPATAGLRTLEDREKAWYQLLFQFTDVAETLLRRDNWKLFRDWLRDDGDLEHYLADLARAASGGRP